MKFDQEEKLLGTLTRQQRRRVYNVMRQRYFAARPSPDILAYAEAYKHQSRSYRDLLRDVEWLYATTGSVGFDVVRLERMWKFEWEAQRKRATDMTLKPLKEQKDNKLDHDTDTVWGRGGYFNSIRVPRKKAKGAWKRFAKLFPHVTTHAGQRAWKSKV